MPVRHIALAMIAVAGFAGAASAEVPLPSSDSTADGPAHRVPFMPAPPPTPRPALTQPQANVWPFTSWSYAKAYTYNFFPDRGVQLQIVTDNGGWSPHIRSETLITSDQARAAADLVAASNGTYETTKCTFPRHAIVLFDAGDKPVAAASVCFDCEGILVWPDYEHPEVSEETDYEADIKRFLVTLGKWKTLFAGFGLPTDFRSTMPGAK